MPLAKAIRSHVLWGKTCGLSLGWTQSIKKFANPGYGLYPWTKTILPSLGQKNRNGGYVQYLHSEYEIMGLFFLGRLGFRSLQKGPDPEPRSGFQIIKIDLDSSWSLHAINIVQYSQREQLYFDSMWVNKLLLQFSLGIFIAFVT